MIEEAYFRYDSTPNQDKDRFDDFRKSLQQDLEDEEMEAQADVDLHRARYLKNIERFKQDAVEEAADKGLEGFRVRLYGEELSAANDIIFVTYVVSSETTGNYDAIIKYFKELAIQKDLDKWFQTDPHSNVHMEEEKEVGERVEVYFPKKNHDIEALKKDEVDPVGRAEPEDDGGGGF
jgi:hypothetical protein